MIINNGYYQYETYTGGGEDECGRPMEATAQWSVHLPCRIETNSDTRKGVYEDGSFRMASFYLLIEPLIPFAYRRLRLERMGEQIGEYDVIRVEPLEAVDAIKVTVANSFG